MTIEVVAWGEHPFVASQFEVSLAPGAMDRAARQVLLQAPRAWPRHVGADPMAKPIELSVALRSGTLAADQRVLQEWFAPGTEALLAIEDDGVRKEIRAVSLGTSAYDGSPGRFRVVLSAAEPRWKGELLSRGELVAATGGQWIATNPGNAVLDDPVLTIRPLSNKPTANGPRYMFDSVIAWRAARAADSYAIDVTGGGWDHAAEVAAGRSVASGNDVRVFVDGLEVPHWFGENAATDPNSATTSIWINGSWGPARRAVLLTAMTAGSPGPNGEVEVVEGGTLGWPDRGYFLIGGELIYYAGRTEANRNGRAAFLGVTRARRSTSAGAHAAGDEILFVQHRVQVAYGDTGLAAPAARLDVKPLLDLASATLANSRHEWAIFADDRYPARSMPWSRTLTTRYLNYGSILEASGGPLAAMGASYRDEGPVAGAPNFNVWRRAFPSGLAASGSAGYRAHDGGNFTTTTSVTRNKPTGVLVDDPLIAVLVWAADPGAITPPAGWVEIASQVSTATFKVYVRYVVASGEPATHQWTWVNAVSGSSVIYGTMGLSSPVVLGQGTVAGTAVLPATVTPRLSPSWIVTISGKVTNAAFTAPTGFTERFEASANVGLAVSDRLYSAARNERLALSGSVAAGSAGAYAVLQLPIRGPIRFVKSIADSLALAHFVVDGDGNQILSGYDVGEGAAAGVAEFVYTGAEQTFVVPAGVTSIGVEARGAAGAAAGAAGGAGALVLATLAVTPAETLRIYVGRAGQGATGGYNGGANGDDAAGGGGGATDLRQGGAALGNRKVTAGGGGGGSGGVGGAGGAQSGAAGGAGVPGFSGAPAEGGAGATTGAGGAGGAGSGEGGAAGSAGSSGAGGAGGAGAAGGGDGGGGGGGAFGGGGGGGGGFQTVEEQDYYGSGGGGGGGSSDVGSGTSNVLYFAGVQSGDGLLRITYTLPSSASPNAWVPHVASPVFEHDFVTLSPVAARPPDGGPISTRIVSATATDQAFQFRTGSLLSYLAAVRFRCESATGGTLQAHLYSDNGSDQLGSLLASSEVEVIAASSVEFDAVLSFAPIVPMLPGTKFWIAFVNALDASTDVVVQVVSVPYTFRSKDDANYRTDRTYRFALSVTPDNVEDFDGAARANDGAANSYSALSAFLDPDGVPSVTTQARVGCYRFDAVLYNETTGQSVRIRALAQLGDVLMLPVRAGTAFNASADDESIFAGLEFSDPGGKLVLAPGANVLRYVEPGVAGVSILLEGRPRWE